MKEQSLKAYAKINLGLDVLRRRPDGYHDLRMVMQTVGLCDEITLRVVEGANAKRTDMDKTQARTDIHLSVHGGGELVRADSENLAYRAAQLLMEEFGIRQGLEIGLKKQIPIAAGLAGGSADAAAVLIGVNALFELGLSEEELMRRGVQLGADVPYCILKGAALAEGIGEQLTPLPPVPEAFVLLAKPPVAVSTKYVYSNLGLGKDDIRHPDIDAQVRAIRDGDLHRMAALMGNVLETVTEPAFPVITDIKRRMIEMGAVNAMMSGSGPTVFGLFDDPEKANQAYREFLDGTQASDVFLTDFFRPNGKGTSGVFG